MTARCANTSHPRLRKGKISKCTALRNWLRDIPYYLKNTHTLTKQTKTESREMANKQNKKAQN